MLCKKGYVWRKVTGRPSRNVGCWMAIGYEASKEDVYGERLLLADAGKKDVGSQKIRCSVKKEDGRMLAGQAGIKAVN